MCTDIEIANKVQLKDIKFIASKLSLKASDLEMYGNNIAKINSDYARKKKGKLILVTAINPTPLGEGKTTTAIGLADGLSKIGKRVCLALREPSLGPVFGLKGGATGGGHAQVVPMEKINLHFTGDIHAITTANNLISEIIDNHIFQGNALNIDPNNIIWKRCLDMNARALRQVTVNQSKEKANIPREDYFVITAASEMMAILCLSKDLVDLKERVANIAIAYNFDGELIYVKDLNIQDAVAILLEDAIRPNLVQTLEGTPAIIHGGPFANIAHGCNSIIATNKALSLADYVVTESGFGADLGAEKFFDIKCRMLDIRPDHVVLVTTLRSLRYNGGATKEEANNSNIEFLKLGIVNLKRHIENLTKVFKASVIIALNKFTNDTKDEIGIIEHLARDLNVEFALCDSWAKGGEGAIELAKLVVNKKAPSKSQRAYAYKLDQPIKSKIEAIAKKIYRAKKVTYSDLALKKIEVLTKMGKDKLPICIAKTQYSFTDDDKILGAPEDFTFNIRDIELRNGAGFLVAVAGSMMLMPGLPKEPAATKMKIDENNKIEGLF